MSYSSHGRRPPEWASKSSHHHLIKDDAVQELLSRLRIPESDPGTDFETRLHDFAPVGSEIGNIVAIDGGYTETFVRKEYPSSTIHFFQFGAILMQLADLEHIADSPFISPDDMARLNNIERLKLALPTRALRLESEASMQDSIRRIIYEFFVGNAMGESLSLLDTRRRDRFGRKGYEKGFYVQLERARCLPHGHLSAA